VGYDEATSKFVLKTTLSNAEKFGPIFTLHYAESILYAGCNNYIAVWELSIPANHCVHKEPIPTSAQGSVIAISKQPGQLVYALREGYYAAVSFNPEVTVDWVYEEPDVLPSPMCRASPPWSSPKTPKPSTYSSSGPLPEESNSTNSPPWLSAE
jgi:hypothetical protein